MDKHVTVVAAINIAFGGILFVVGLFLFIVLAGSGLFSGDPEAMFITGTIASALGIFFTMLGLPGIIAGFGLLSRKHWARILTVILSVLNLMAIPLGTIIGIYSIWVLLHNETVVLFDA